MAKVTRTQGQKFLTAEQYGRVNARVMGDIRDFIRDEFGVCSPRDVLDYVAANQGPIRQTYIEMGLRGVELERTYDNLQIQANVGMNQQGLHQRIARAYGGEDRRVLLTR